MNNRNEIVITGFRDRLVMLYIENDKIFDVLLEEKPTDEQPVVGNI